jgi:hypothetical protein
LVLVVSLVLLVSLAAVSLGTLVGFGATLVSGRTLVVSIAPAPGFRGPRVSCGVELSELSGPTAVESVLTWPAAVLSKPTLSAVIVALPGRPASPGGPVRVLSSTCVTAVVSVRPWSGAAPTSSSFRLWQAADTAAAAARISSFLIRRSLLPIDVDYPAAAVAVVSDANLMDRPVTD